MRQLSFDCRVFGLNVLAKPLALHVVQHATIPIKVTASRLSNTLVKYVLPPLALDFIKRLMMSTHLRPLPVSRLPP